MIKRFLPLLALSLAALSCHLPGIKHYKGGPYCVKKEIKVPCGQIHKEVLYYWSSDSLGKNGFRMVVADLLVKCKCYIGLNWAEIEKKLGKPNFDEPFDGGRLKTYTLSPEYQYLYILVDEKNIVYKLKIYIRDG